MDVSGMAVVLEQSSGIHLLPREQGGGKKS
jgi:hypothetical protein